MSRFYMVKRKMFGQVVLIFLVHCANPEGKKDSSHDHTKLGQNLIGIKGRDQSIKTTPKCSLYSSEL